MKKVVGRLVAIIIAVALAWYFGVFPSETAQAPSDQEVPSEAASGDVDDEISEDDLKMIEDFLDEIVEAVEQEEAAQ